MAEEPQKKEVEEKKEEPKVEEKKEELKQEASIEEKPKKRFKWKIPIDLILFLIAIGAIYLTYKWSSPIDLEVWHNITDDDGGRIYIYARNNDRFRSTGDIDLYRLESNPHRPHLQLTGNDTLGPREEKRLFSLLIKINRSKEFNLSDDIYEPFTIPSHKIYFIMEKTSISYKIMCDNCRSQGIIQREPDYGVTPPTLILRPDRSVMGTVPIYSWIDYELEDLYD